MLEFINNNPILTSGLFGLITAIVSALITALVTLKIEKKKSEQSKEAKLEEKINDLTLKLNSTNEQLSKYTNIENLEKNIEKGKGAIYTERFENGSKRHICGYCWEREHLKIPINVHLRCSEYTYEQWLSGTCHNCHVDCIESLEPNIDDSEEE